MDKILHVLNAAVVSVCQLLAILVISIGLIKSLTIYVKDALFGTDSAIAIQESRLELGHSFSLGLGFLIKMGSLGLHIWLPGSYAESEDDISTFFSTVLSKAGLYMLFIAAGLFVVPLFSSGRAA